MPTYRFRIDGSNVAVHAEAETPLLHALRSRLRAKGAPAECGRERCGACTVSLDGQPVRSCLMPVSAAAGKSVVTAPSQA